MVSTYYIIFGPRTFGLTTFLAIQEGIKLAIASRSPVDEGGAARGILGALGLLDMFSYLEIHRGSKAVHFQVTCCLSRLRISDNDFRVLCCLRLACAHTCNPRKYALQATNPSNFGRLGYFEEVEESRLVHSGARPAAEETWEISCS